MSLLVQLIPKDKNISIAEFENQIQPPRNDLFGFENWRYSLWGNEVTRLLDCNILHGLNTQDIYVFDKEVTALKKELVILLINLDKIAITTAIDKDAIHNRIQNALNIIAIAEKNIDKIGIFIG